MAKKSAAATVSTAKNEEKQTTIEDAAKASTDPGQQAAHHAIANDVLAVLEASDESMTAQEIQDDLNEDRAEESDHLPIQIVQQALDAHVTAGFAEFDAVDDQKFYRVAADSRAAVLQRRRFIVHTLFDEGGEMTAEQIVTAVKTSKTIACGAKSAWVLADLDALVEANVVLRGADADGEEKQETYFEIDDEIGAELARVGAEVLALRSMPAPVVQASAPTPPNDQSPFVINLKEQLEGVRNEKSILQNRFERVAKWLGDRNISIDGIAAPPIQKPTRTTFQWKKTIPVDDAEKARILDEKLALEQELAEAEMTLDAAKSTFKAQTATIAERIEKLNEAARSDERYVEIDAYRFVDWDAGQTEIRSVDDERVLEVEPLPKGAQREIPGTNGDCNAAPPQQTSGAAAANVPPAETETAPAGLAPTEPPPAGLCATCGSHQPHLHPAAQSEGEVSICGDAFHRTITAQNTPATIAERDAILARVKEPARVGALTSESFERPVLDMFAGAESGIREDDVIDHFVEHTKKPVGPGVASLVKDAVARLVDRKELTSGKIPTGTLIWLSSNDDPRDAIITPAPDEKAELPKKPPPGRRTRGAQPTKGA